MIQYYLTSNSLSTSVATWTFCSYKSRFLLLVIYHSLSLLDEMRLSLNLGILCFVSIGALVARAMPVQRFGTDKSPQGTVLGETTAPVADAARRARHHRLRRVRWWPYLVRWQRLAWGVEAAP